MGKDINKIFKAIADPTRREIFHVLVLASATLSIHQIAVQFDMSRQGVTKHIKLLEDAGLVRISPQGRERFCEAIPDNLKDIKDWAAYYERFWDDKLDALDKHLNS